MKDNFKLLNKWNHLLKYFNLEQKDIFFTEEYAKLYEVGNQKVYGFYYTTNNFHFLLLYILREFQIQEKDYYDFETIYGYGGPLYNYYNKDYLCNAWMTFFEYGYSKNYVAGLIRFHPLLNNYKCFDKVGELLRDRQTVAVDLKLTEEEIWLNEIHSKNRNIIKKGEKNGLQFVADYDFKYLEEFKKLYKDTMIKLDANEFYYYDDEFFNKYKNKIEKSFLGIVLLNSEVIASAIILIYNYYGHYHLAGSNSQYLNLSPNNFLLWNCVKELKKKGVKYFHLGGGKDSDENNSLLKFKMKFSKSRFDFFIGKIIFDNNVYQSLCNDWSKLNRDREISYNSYLLKYKY